MLQSRDTRAQARSDAGGRYAVPLLPPGLYFVHAGAESYRRRECRS
jgi:hypothetical protein